METEDKENNVTKKAKLDKVMFLKIKLNINNNKA